MDAIFHEKQEGSLCAQHCLNALLQGPYFTPVDLGSLAQQMDDEERLRMAENGIESEEYQTFLAQPSGNMDDSGYFSVQVISSALRVWGLELVPYTSTELRAKEAYQCPSKMQAYICHYKDHWFTIRHLGNQWFNLNSLLASPELISDTYLAMFLAQLLQEGYCIFVVFGDLPDCEADHLLKLSPAVPIRKSPVPPPTKENTSGLTQEEKDLQKALMLSLGAHCSSSQSDLDDDVGLQKALSLSLESSNPIEEESSDEEAQLRKAVALSLECKSASSSTPSTPCADPSEIRQRRLTFLNQIGAKKSNDNI